MAIRGDPEIPMADGALRGKYVAPYHYSTDANQSKATSELPNRCGCVKSLGQRLSRSLGIQHHAKVTLEPMGPRIWDGLKLANGSGLLECKAGITSN